MVFIKIFLFAPTNPKFTKKLEGSENSVVRHLGHCPPWRIFFFNNSRPSTVCDSTVFIKILFLVIQDALLSWFKQMNFLPETQYGFRPGKSVDMALAVAQTDWINAKARNELVGIMVFDLLTAFDTLEHLLLLRKLESASIKGIPLKWFQSYLSNCSQCVLWNSILSNYLPLNKGIPGTPGQYPWSNFVSSNDT